MLYRVLADAVLILHLCFVAFVVLGGLVVLRWPRLAWLHVPVALWGVYIEFSGRICPLTPLENSLRQRAGESTYSGGFIDHYLTALIYPQGLSRSQQFVLGTVVIAVNAIVYWMLLRRRRAAHRHGKLPPTDSA